MEDAAERDHELIQFVRQDLAQMISEYERFRARSTEDPGTAGDEGEEAWAELLRSWLPESYVIVTKGRILGADGRAGPQVDVVVLKPGYPARLRSKKLYLAGGVAAAFECKNTLTMAHIDHAFSQAKAINLLTDRNSATLFGEAVPAIPFGVLAHSHTWQGKSSNPVLAIDAALARNLETVEHITDPPVMFCVADLVCWDALRHTYDGPGYLPEEAWAARMRLGVPPEGQAQFSYMRHVEEQGWGSPPPNAIGPAIAFLLDRLAHEDVAARSMSQYLHAAGMSGSGAAVAAKAFPLSIYSEEVRRQLPRRLTGGRGSEWAVMYPF